MKVVAVGSMNATRNLERERERERERDHWLIERGIYSRVGVNNCGLLNEIVRINGH